MTHTPLIETNEANKNLKVVVLRDSYHISADSRLKNIARDYAAAGFNTTVVYLSQVKNDEGTIEDGVRYLPVKHINIARNSSASKRNKRKFRRYPLYTTGSDRAFKRRRTQVEISETVSSLKLQDHGLISRIHKTTKVHLLRASLKLQDKRKKKLSEREKRFNDKLAKDGPKTNWRQDDPSAWDLEFTFARILDRLDPDIIQAQDTTTLGVAARYAERMTCKGKNTLLSADILEDWGGIPLNPGASTKILSARLDQEREYLPKFDVITTVNTHIATTLMERHPNLKTEVLVVMNCTRVSDLSEPAVSLRERLGISLGTPLMIYAGGVSKARGIDVAIESLQYAPQMVLAVIPVPYPHPMENKLISLAKSLGVDDRLFFAPPAQTEEIVAYLSDADIGLLPVDARPRNHAHGTPNKLFEYMHAGLPIVTTNVYDVVNFVNKYNFGAVFEYPDAKACAKACIHVYKQTQDGSIGRVPKETLREYSWETQGKTLQTAIQIALGRRSTK